MSHVSFVGVFVAVQDARTDVVLLEHGVVRFNSLRTLFTEPDVKNLQLTYELLVLGEEKSQFLLLQCQCQVGLDDIGSYVVGVVFGHQT